MAAGIKRIRSAMDLGDQPIAKQARTRSRSPTSKATIATIATVGDSKAPARSPKKKLGLIPRKSKSTAAAAPPPSPPRPKLAATRDDDDDVAASTPVHTPINTPVPMPMPVIVKVVVKVEPIRRLSIDEQRMIMANNVKLFIPIDVIIGIVAQYLQLVPGGVLASPVIPTVRGKHPWRTPPKLTPMDLENDYRTHYALAHHILTVGHDKVTSNINALLNASTEANVVNSALAVRTLMAWDKIQLDSGGYERLPFFDAKFRYILSALSDSPRNTTTWGVAIAHAFINYLQSNLTAEQCHSFNQTVIAASQLNKTRYSWVSKWWNGTSDERNRVDDLPQGWEAMNIWSVIQLWGYRIGGCSSDTPFQLWCFDLTYCVRQWTLQHKEPKVWHAFATILIMMISNIGLHRAEIINSTWLPSSMFAVLPLLSSLPAVMTSIAPPPPNQLPTPLADGNDVKYAATRACEDICSSTIHHPQYELFIQRYHYS